MSDTSDGGQWATEAGVREDLRQQHLYLKLTENALTVAESVRDNYFANTAKFVSHLRQAMRLNPPILMPRAISDVTWKELHDEVVTFIDGGVGRVQISSQMPILLRVGSYCVRTGEARLATREQFGYYPIILGDLEGGSKERKDFIDIVRITAELLGGLSALQRSADLRMLMFHGPLVYEVGHYAGHTPFTEHDIDIFMQHYASEPMLGTQLKEDFLSEARLEIYPKMSQDRADVWSKQRVFEPLAWMAFLYRRLICMAHACRPIPNIVGVVERGELKEFSKTVLLDRVFRGLRTKGNIDYFNKHFGRNDLTSPEALVNKLGYTDSLLLGMLLHPGEMSEAWEVDKYLGLNAGDMALPGESWEAKVKWHPLRPPAAIGFPRVQAAYVHVNETTEPVRVEVFPELGSNQLFEACQRVYLYSRLLPGYGFPVGLDIADKYAKVPAWLTDAYSKLIRHHLGVSLQSGEISDAEMRRILVQAIYMTHRDWLFRPNA